MSDGYVLRLMMEFDLAPLIRLIKNRDYMFRTRARFYVVKGAVEYLTHVRDCVRTRVRAAGRRGRKLVAATSWMEEADGLILAFQKLESEYDLIPKLFWGPSLDFWSSYRVGRDASQMLPQVTRLCAEGAEIVRRVKLPQPMDVSTGFASRDHILRAAIARVKDEKGGVVGIWGHAGLGKTHLIKLMEEYFLRDDSFDLVLRIVVQKDSSISKVQAEITKKLMLANCEGNKTKERIFDFLKERNFLLLVDCLWHWLDLAEIGVPSLDQVGNYRRKLVFTTCFSHVCDQMNVELGDRIEVHCLAPTESLEFLRQNPNIDYFDHLYMLLQRNISRELLGSPLDLIAIGNACMHSKKDAKYWENALGYLSQSRLNETQGEDTEEAKFSILKIVYDSLTGNLKDCFKSCSLWPEGHIFHKRKLVDFWIGMGLLQQGDIEKAYNEGFSIIATLLELCLVESAEDDEAVLMQPTIRDFVLWIVHDQGKSKNKWAIQNKEHWGLAEQVLVVALKITELPYIPSNQESLKVLVLQDNYLKDSSLSNFHSLNSLQYLDFSFNKFFSIPLEICMLVHLRYLNLSHNMIKTVPMELGCLTKLRHLHLRNNPIQVIPNGILPKFQNLAVLDICSFDFLRCPSSCVVSLDELELMDSLQSLGITVHSDILRISKTTLPIKALCVISINNNDSDSIPDFSNSPSVNPDRCTDLFELGIYTWEKTIVFDGIHLTWNLCHVEKAYLRGCFVNKIIWQSLHPEDIFASLRRLDIVRCRNLTSISWILHLPLLQDLLLFSCSLLRQIIATSEDGVTETSTSNEKNESSSICYTFPRLKKLTLIEADRLVSICNPTFGFPSLEYLQIYACPSLKNLPFLIVPRKLKFIRGENEWWDGLEWQDTDLQSSLELYFHGFSSEDQLSEMHIFNSLQVEWARINEDFGE